MMLTCNHLVLWTTAVCNFGLSIHVTQQQDDKMTEESFKKLQLKKVLRDWVTYRFTVEPLRACRISKHRNQHLLTLFFSFCFKIKMLSSKSKRRDENKSKEAQKLKQHNRMKPKD